MWNKLAEMMQDASFKRLGWALFISVLLHFFLLGKFHLLLPNNQPEMHIIEARLQMPIAAAKSSEADKPVAAPEEAPTKPKKQAKAEPDIKPNIEKPESVQELLPIENTPVEDLQPQPTPPEPLNLPSELDVPKSKDIGEPLPASASEPQPVDTGLVINENAYQYVETEFDVRTKIDGSAQGKATIIFNVIGDQYQLKWLTQPSGVAALFIGDLLQTSAGALTKAGLQPATYQYQFGNKADKARLASFDWQTKKLILQTAKGTKTEELPDAAQDMLSFMYQFMYVSPLQTMQIAITNGKKMKSYDYSFEGEENINSALGELKTIHIVHTGSVEEDKTELWLAIDYQYIPVKIRKTESENKVYELLATRININRPVVDIKK